jgi:hypothetical protein
LVHDLILMHFNAWSFARSGLSITSRRLWQHGAKEARLHSMQKYGLVEARKNDGSNLMLPVVSFVGSVGCSPIEPLFGLWFGIPSLMSSV